jgi:hypothetical protein
MTHQPTVATSWWRRTTRKATPMTEHNTQQDTLVRLETLEKLVNELVDRLPSNPLPGSPAAERYVIERRERARKIEEERAAKTAEAEERQRAVAVRNDLSRLEGLLQDPHLMRDTPADLRNRAVLHHFEVGCCGSCCQVGTHRHSEPGKYETAGISAKNLWDQLKAQAAA